MSAPRTSILDKWYDAEDAARVRADIDAIAAAFGIPAVTVLSVRYLDGPFRPPIAPVAIGCIAADVRTIIEPIEVALDVLGMTTEQFRALGLALGARPETFKSFDGARRLGANTEELQRILLSGLFNEPPT